MDKADYIKQYEKTSGANSYEIGFIFHADLYVIKLNKLDETFVRITTESSKRGGYAKLRLYVNNSKKAQWLATGKATKLMSEEEFLNRATADNLNRGQEFEKIRAEVRGISYKLDNVRYDKAGDIKEGSEEIQVKFENASIAQLRLIERVANI